MYYFDFFMVKYRNNWRFSYLDAVEVVCSTDYLLAFGVLRLRPGNDVNYTNIQVVLNAKEPSAPRYYIAHSQKYEVYFAGSPTKDWTCR